MITSFPRGSSSVLYIEDFDEPPPAPAGAPPGSPEEQPMIIAPSYTADDVEAAREEGRLAALEDQDALQAALGTAALTSIADELAKAREQASAVAARRADDITGMVLALLQAALPATAARVAPDEVVALLGVLLPPLSREPGVALRVHPDVLPLIEHRLATMRDMTLTADRALAASDLELTWRDGEARRDSHALWRGIAAALTPFDLPQDLNDILLHQNQPHDRGDSHGG